MGRKKKFKLDDISGDQIEDKEAEALEPDDPSLDDDGNPLVKDDEGDAPKSDEPEPEAAAEPEADKPEDSADPAKPIPVTELDLPVMLDTADNTAKDQSGQVFDDSNKTEPVADSDVPAAEPELQMDPPAGTPETVNLGEQSPEAAALPDDRELVLAQGQSVQPAEDGEEAGAQDAEDARDEAPAPDPASMPGMAPTQTIGETEAHGGIGSPVTVLDGVSKGDSVPELGELHELAKPLEDALEGDVLGGLKDAGNAASEAVAKLRDAEDGFGQLPEDARAIARDVKIMGLHFIGALEKLFRRK